MDGKKSLGYRIFRTLLLPLQRLPLGFHYFWGRVFAWVAKNILHYRSDVVLVNLSRSFPELKYGDIKKLYDGFYTHLGEVFAETCWFGGCSGRPGRLRRQGLCTARGEEELIGAFKNRPSVMILSSHYGNWEITGGIYDYFSGTAVCPEGMDPDHTNVVYKRLTSRFWNEFFTNNRTAPLVDYRGSVESKEVLRFALEHKNEKRIYIFPTDQFPYRGATRTAIPGFMSQPTMVMTGGATLAHKFGMAVFYMAIDKVEKGRYHMVFRKICDDASQMDTTRIMTEYYALLEESVRSHPENYLWSHKRWK